MEKVCSSSISGLRNPVAWLNCSLDLHCRAVGSCEAPVSWRTLEHKGFVDFSPEAGFWDKYAGKKKGEKKPSR